MTDSSNEQPRPRGHKKGEIGRRIPFWIWCLAGSGMAAGLLILSLLTRHLLQLDSVNEEFAEQRRLLNDITGDLQEPLARIETAFIELFQNEAVTEVPEFNAASPKASVERLVNLKLPETVQESAFGLVERIESGVSNLRQCVEWRQGRRGLEERRRRALTRAQNLVRSLGEQNDELITEIKSENAVLLERINTEKDKQKVVRAMREFAVRNTTLRETQLTALKRELQDLTPLVLHMFLNEDLEKLSEAREQVRLVLDTMEQSIAAARDTGLDKKADDLATTLKALRAALSSGNAEEGNAQDLFAIHRRWLLYQREGELLENGMHNWRAAVRQSMRSLEYQLDRASVEASLDMQERLWSLLTTSLVFGGLAGALFLLLARAISRAALVQIRELQNARRAAREAARAQSLFLANMSHEIRTPMNGVLGMAEMLSESELDEQQRQYATTIKSSAEALLTVINDILDFTKIEAGKLQLNILDFDLRGSVEDTLDLLSHMASSKGIELVCFIEHRVPRCVRGDPDRLRQVLLNLAGNAVKFTAEGEISILVEFIGERDDDTLVRFAVRDTGIGIDEETQQRLFNPFTQADATTTRRFGGTGLGLAISRRLIEAMGGTIELQSQIGVGSTFSFTVPLRAVEGAVGESAPTDFGGRSALIVDDNETNREILGLRLADWKMGFDTAVDGHQALNLLREVHRRGYRFDVALVDLHMAPSDGLTFAREIRQDPDLAKLRLPIVILSSTGPKPADVDLEENGVHAWLTKPVRERRLRQALQNAFSNQPSGVVKAVGGQAIEAGSGDLGLNILVAEDNMINQRVIREMLRKIGCKSEFADNGRIAVERLKEGGFDLVLMDCQMPEMDGYTATRTIRGLEGNLSEIPILALTANVLPDDRAACLDCGMNGFLGKPVKKDQLLSALRTWSRPLVTLRTEASTPEPLAITAGEPTTDDEPAESPE